MKKLIKSTAILLFMALLCTCIPMTLWAKAAEIDLSGLINWLEGEENPEDITINSNGLSELEIMNEQIVLYEDISKRSLTEKHFLLDGSYMVKETLVPVHYYDGSEYRDIDNTLYLNELGNNGFYANGANSFNVTFPVNASPAKDHMIINYEGYYLGMKLLSNGGTSINSVNAVAPIDMHSSYNAMSVEGIKAKDVNNTAPAEGRLSYPSIIGDNINLEYKVSSMGVKENIIINQPSSIYSFKYEINGNLTLALSESGEIHAVNESNKTIFIIPAPFMYDANEEYSKSVHYELTEYDVTSEIKTYSITVVADEQWINSSERAFPVTVDPEVAIQAAYYVVKRNHKSQTIDTNPSAPYKVGYVDSYENNDFYFKFVNSGFERLYAFSRAELTFQIKSESYSGVLKIHSVSVSDFDKIYEGSLMTPDVNPISFEGFSANSTQSVTCSISNFADTSTAFRLTTDSSAIKSLCYN